MTLWAWKSPRKLQTFFRYSQLMDAALRRPTLLQWSSIPNIPHTTAASGFNNGKGGVYAVEWRAAIVYLWQWVRDAVPADLKNGTSPDPSSWGSPYVQLTGDCQQRLYIQIWTTFCAPWAQNDYFNSSCFSTAPLCTDYVSQHPSAFQDAYVSIFLCYAASE